MGASAAAKIPAVAPTPIAVPPISIPPASAVPAAAPPNSLPIPGMRPSLPRKPASFVSFSAVLARLPPLLSGLLPPPPADFNCSYARMPNIDTVTSQPKISLYPNPTSGTFTLSYNSQLSLLNSQLKIYDVLGQEVYQQQINQSSQTTINISQLSNGV